MHIICNFCNKTQIINHVKAVVHILQCRICLYVIDYYKSFVAPLFYQTTYKLSIFKKQLFIFSIQQTPRGKTAGRLLVHLKQFCRFHCVEPRQSVGQGPRANHRNSKGLAIYTTKREVKKFTSLFAGAP